MNRASAGQMKHRRGPMAHCRQDSMQQLRHTAYSMSHPIHCAQRARMAAQAHDPAHPSKLEHQGLTQAEAQEAINTYAKHVELRVHMRAQLREAVDHAYMDDLPLVSEATQKQAKRTANARVRLIQDEGAAT